MSKTYSFNLLTLLSVHVSGGGGGREEEHSFLSTAEYS